MPSTAIIEQTLRDIAQQHFTVVPHPTLLSSVQQLSYPLLHQLERLAICYQRAKTAPAVDSSYLTTLAMQILTMLGAATTEAAAPIAPAISPTAKTPTLKDYWPWFIQLTDLTQPHLGTALVCNYWLLARPNDPWLQSIRVDTLLHPQPSHPNANHHLSPQEETLLQCWLGKFIGYCSRILPTLPSEAVTAGLPLPLVQCSLGS